jgi:hypothetical protein
MAAIQFEGLEIQSGEVEGYIRDVIVHVDEPGSPGD